MNSGNIYCKISILTLRKTIESTETTDFFKICYNSIPKDDLFVLIEKEFNDKNVYLFSKLIQSIPYDEKVIGMIESNLPKLKYRTKVIQEAMREVAKKDPVSYLFKSSPSITEKKLQKPETNLSKVLSKYFGEMNRLKFPDYVLSSSSLNLFIEILKNTDIDFRILILTIRRIKDIKKLDILQEYILKKEAKTFTEIINLCESVLELIDKDIKFERDQLDIIYHNLMKIFDQNIKDITSHQMTIFLKFNQIMLKLNNKQINEKIYQLFLDIINEIPEKDSLKQILKIITTPFTLGNKYPYLKENYQICLEIGFEIGRKNRDALFEQFIDDNFNVNHIPNLIYLLDHVRCSEKMFQKIWDQYFDAFKSMSELEPEILQISSLKLITKLLSLIKTKFNSELKKKIYVDSILGQAIFNGFLKFAEHIIQNQKNYNREFVKEFLRSILLIICENPNAVEHHELESDFQMILHKSSHLVSYESLEILMNQLYQDDYDRLMSYYVILIITKCFKFTKNEKILTSVLSRAFSTKGLKEAGFNSLLQIIDRKSIITHFIPILAPIIQKKLLNQKTVDLHLLLVDLVAKIIMDYREASIHNLSSKSIITFFNIVSSVEYSLALVKRVYISLQKLILNYSLSSNERLIIYQMTQKTTQEIQSPRNTSNTIVKKSLKLEKDLQLDTLNNRYPYYLGLVMASFYSQSINKTEHDKLQFNVLHLYNQYQGLVNCYSETFLKILPPLLEDFVEIDQILPLIIPTFLKKDYYDQILIRVLNNYFKKKSKQNDYEDWIIYTINTVELKIESSPISCLKVLSCLFLSCLNSKYDYCENLDYEREDIFSCLIFDFIQYLKDMNMILALKSLKECLKKGKIDLFGSLLSQLDFEKKK